MRIARRWPSRRRTGGWAHLLGAHSLAHHQRAGVLASLRGDLGGAEKPARTSGARVLAVSAPSMAERHPARMYELMISPPLCARRVHSRWRGTAPSAAS